MTVNYTYLPCLLTLASIAQKNLIKRFKFKFKGSYYILTRDLLDSYYNRHITLHRPPFSIWLEDVYIGLLAEEFNTTVNDLTPNNVPHEQYRVISKEYKAHMIKQKGISNTLFVYEKNETMFLWSFLMKEINLNKKN